MDYVEGGNLSDYLNFRRDDKVDESEIRKIIMNILFSLDFMHKRGILHKDIKPANILLSARPKNNLKIKVADFGFSCKLDDKERIYGRCGTPGYMAPEIFNNFGFTVKADIYSLGVIFYNLITGK